MICESGPQPHKSGGTLIKEKRNESFTKKTLSAGAVVATMTAAETVLAQTSPSATAKSQEMPHGSIIFLVKVPHTAIFIAVSGCIFTCFAATCWGRTSRRWLIWAIAVPSTVGIFWWLNGRECMPNRSAGGNPNGAMSRTGAFRILREESLSLQTPVVPACRAAQYAPSTDFPPKALRVRRRPLPFRAGRGLRPPGLTAGYASFQEAMLS